MKELQLDLEAYGDLECFRENQDCEVGDQEVPIDLVQRITQNHGGSYILIS